MRSIEEHAFELLGATCLLVDAPTGKTDCVLELLTGQIIAVDFTVEFSVSDAENTISITDLTVEALN